MIMMVPSSVPVSACESHMAGPWGMPQVATECFFPPSPYGKQGEPLVAAFCRAPMGDAFDVAVPSLLPSPQT